MRGADKEDQAAAQGWQLGEQRTIQRSSTSGSSLLRTSILGWPPLLSCALGSLCERTVSIVDLELYERAGFITEDRHSFELVRHTSRAVAS